MATLFVTVAVAGLPLSLVAAKPHKEPPPGQEETREEPPPAEEPPAEDPTLTEDPPVTESTEETVLEEPPVTETTVEEEAAAENSPEQDQPAGPEGPSQGTIKVNGVDIDDIPQNQPHQGCDFRIEFFGFEGPLGASASITLVPPTVGGSTGANITLEDDPAGGSSDFDGSIDLLLFSIPGFENLEPHPNQGFHVDINAAVDGFTKQKTVWVRQCQAPGVEPPVPGIDVDKSCPAEVDLGDRILYEITVTNTGEEALQDLVVEDSLLGDLSGDFPDELNVGNSVTRRFTRDTSEGDPDPLGNAVRASATGVVSAEAVTDTADCVTDLLPPPAPVVIPREEPPILAVTGITVMPFLAAALGFLLSGAGLVRLGGRRKEFEAQDAIADEVDAITVADEPGYAAEASTRTWSPAKVAVTVAIGIAAAGAIAWYVSRRRNGNA